ncbi:hypothetical protein C1646_747777 [Rhizophagus diaphanus]|nr:hypothetical protein C1646_747777 [Rhizophagus diaphanus] [Rhizophagus sp. MUCL 43196]
MEKSTNIKHKIDFLLSNDALSSNQTQKTIKIKKKYDVLSSSHQIQKTFKIKKKCSECNKIRTPSDENNQVCYTCNKAKKRIIPSGNKVIDDFIKYTQTNCAQRIGRMMFVPYEKFKNIKLIGEGGFSKIYKSTWIDSKISEDGILNYYLQNESKTVALKKINNSKNITSKELTEIALRKNLNINSNDDEVIYLLVYGISEKLAKCVNKKNKLLQRSVLAK